MKPLTEKQAAALAAALENGGQLFQLPERPAHSPKVLAHLVRGGLLERKRVGVVWEITPLGRDAINRFGRS